MSLKEFSTSIDIFSPKKQKHYQTYDIYLILCDYMNFLNIVCLTFGLKLKGIRRFK